MKNSIEYGFDDTPIRVSHVAVRDLETELSLPIDHGQARLEWVSICLTEPVSLDAASLS